MKGKLVEMIVKVWATLRLAAKTFLRIDGAQWAAALSFDAFFSLFPLIILVVTIASFSLDRATAGKEVVAYIESTFPLSRQMEHHVFETIAGVIQERGKAGAIASLFLIWVALQCFTTLICATNNAWGTKVSNWWRLQLISLTLLGITVITILLGLTAPVLLRLVVSSVLPSIDDHSWIYELASFFIPLLLVFFGLSMFYKLAPHRSTKFAEVWVVALCVTIFLRAGVSLFVIYLENFTQLNAVYGALGGIMALLTWIYVSGCCLIFGACLCASGQKA
ncbi:MAG: YihY/virulence factor BrkB family protein [Bacteroidota bacterium]